MVFQMLRISSVNMCFSFLLSETTWSLRLTFIFFSISVFSSVFSFFFLPLFFYFIHPFIYYSFIDLSFFHSFSFYLFFLLSFFYPTFSNISFLSYHFPFTYPSCPISPGSSNQISLFHGFISTSLLTVKPKDNP